MKLKSLITALSFCVIITACSKTEVSHNANVLPEKARTVLSQNFTSAITLVKTTSSVASSKEYEVTLANGTEIEFKGNGEWTSVETPSNVAVPSGLVPTAISNYVKTKHAGAIIVGIEKEKKGYSIDLSNDIELNFDQEGNFLSQD